MDSSELTNRAGELSSLESALRDVFGFEALRAPQEQALAEVLTGDDTVIVMPTGTGKSLCYQLPGVVSGGLTLVISPLISLMKDQVDALSRLGLDARALNSSQSSEERMAAQDGVRSGEVQFLFCAPERLSNESFQSLITQVKVARVVIDEAHCVSSWGHDFRPDYLRIGAFLERINRPQVLALTATATPRVRADICSALGLGQPRVVVTGFDRPNLSIDVVRVRKKAERQVALLDAIRSFEVDEAPVGGAVLIYTASRKNADAVSSFLTRSGVGCGVYHAGLDAQTRRDVQDAFMGGELNVVAATNAFGMGIDRADVRQVIHYDMPGSLEAWYQEIGRAGRDGLPSRGVLLFSEISVKLQQFFIDRSHPSANLLHQIYDIICEQTATGSAVLEGQIEDAFDDEPSAVAAARRLVGWGLVGRVGHMGGFMAIEADRTIDECLHSFPISERREADEFLLHAIVTCARGRRCRWRSILAYFQGTDVAENCGRCDVCEGVQPERSLTEDEVLVLRKLLSGVARVRGYAGKRKIAAMLMGSQSQDVSGTWLERLSTYGVLEGQTASFLGDLLDACLDAGYVSSEGSRYPVLILTPEGADVLASRTVPEMRWPGSSFQARRRAGAASDVASDSGVGTQEDDAARSRLEAWRRREASQRALPAYCVFSNRTLDELLRRRPATLEELQEIHGFGPKRMEDCGEQVLDCLNGNTEQA